MGLVSIVLYALSFIYLGPTNNEHFQTDGLSINTSLHVFQIQRLSQASCSPLRPGVFGMGLGVPRPFHISVLNDMIDLLQFRLGEHNVTTCRILKGTLDVPGGIHDYECK